MRGRETQRRYSATGLALVGLLVMSLSTGCTAPLPAPAGSTPVVQLANGAIRLWSDSAAVEPGVKYQVTIGTHCGFGPIDFAGGFWTSGSVPEWMGDPAAGTIRLIGVEEAEFTSQGRTIPLEFLGPGPIDIPPCD